MTEDDLTLLAAVLAGLATTLLAASSLPLARRRVVRLRLWRFTRGRASAAASPSWRRRSLELAQRLGAACAPLLPPRLGAWLARRYRRAGEPGALTPEQVLGLRAAAAAAAALLGLAVALAGIRSGAAGVLAGLLLVAVGLAAPDAWLGLRAAARRRAIRRDLPTFVDLLALCLGAGMGLELAIATVVERQPGQLSAELRRYLASTGDLGLGRPQALRLLAERVATIDVDVFVDALIRASEQGTGLLVAVSAQARLLRQQRRRQAQTAAQRAPVRMVVPMTLFILPVLMLVVLGPVVLRLLRASGGVAP